VPVNDRSLIEIGMIVGGPEFCWGPTVLAIGLITRRFAQKRLPPKSQTARLNLVVLVPGSVASDDRAGLRCPLVHKRPKLVTVEVFAPPAIRWERKPARPDLPDRNVPTKEQMRAVQGFIFASLQKAIRAAECACNRAGLTFDVLGCQRLVAQVEAELHALGGRA
jgi:hypothetical protein